MQEECDRGGQDSEKVDEPAVTTQVSTDSAEIMVSIDPLLGLPVGTRNDGDKKDMVVDPLLGVQVETRQVFSRKSEPITRASNIQPPQRKVVDSLFDDSSDEDDDITDKKESDGHDSNENHQGWAQSQSTISPNSSQKLLLQSLTATGSGSAGSLNLFDDSDLPPVSDDDNEENDVEGDSDNSRFSCWIWSDCGQCPGLTS